MKHTLSAILHAAQQSATGQQSSAVSNHRARLIDRYYGEPYGDEVADRSQYVDTSVRDVIESVKPELMDIFFGGDRVAEFAPRGDEDVEAAEQETDAVNHVFSNMNQGFYIALGWFHDALAFKNGYVKRSWEERLKPEVEEYEDLTPDERVAVLMGALDRGEVAILEEELDESGFSLKIEITPKEPYHYKIENVPPEEVIVSPEWTRLDFTDCPFVAHKRVMTVSDLVEMGFDRKQVEALPSYDSGLDSEEKSNRRETDDFSEGGTSDTIEPSMRQVLVYENYIRHDRDGDGIAELLQVYTGGDRGEILRRDGEEAVERVDAAPFNVLCPIPIPHKHYGISYAELVEHDARVRTVLIRQLLDNVVSANNPDIIVDSNQSDAETDEDLQQTGLGRVIRAPGGMATVGYMPIPDHVSGVLAALQMIEAEKENRTGVTRLNQGLDADAINKTFGGMKALMNAAQKKILLIARVFAETGFRQLFQDIHRDLRKGPMRRIVLRMRNRFVEVDPRTWADRADMTVSVGLGTGNRDVQLQGLSLILPEQKEALAAGLVEPKHLHHTLSTMLQLMGFKDVNAFFPEPQEGPMPPPEQPADPAMIMAQVEQMKIQAKQQAEMAKLESDRQIERERLAQEREIAFAEIQSRERIAMMTLHGKAEIESAKISKDITISERGHQEARQRADERFDRP